MALTVMVMLQNTIRGPSPYIQGTLYVGHTKLESCKCLEVERTLETSPVLHQRQIGLNFVRKIRLFYGVVLFVKEAGYYTKVLITIVNLPTV